MVSDLPIEWEAEPAQAPRCPVPGWGSYHRLDAPSLGVPTGNPAPKAQESPRPSGTQVYPGHQVRCG